MEERTEGAEVRTRGQIIGSNVKAVRTAKAYSYAELAEESGVTKNNIVKLEAGQTDRPRRRTLVKIANALEVPVERFLEGTAEYEREMAHQAARPLGEAFPEAKARAEAEGQKIREERARASESRAEARARQLRYEQQGLVRIRASALASEEATREINRLYDALQAGEIGMQEYQEQLIPFLRAMQARSVRAASDAG